MNWVEIISKTLNYIENHLKEQVTLEEIAENVNVSAFYLQKVFALICGIPIMEYARNRRLSLAGRDIQDGMKIIDVALMYGYESPDSFTKAFHRFHGVTPMQVKNGNGQLRWFMPLQIHIEAKGGFKMDCRIVKKGPMKIVGYSEYFHNDEGYIKCPLFWDEHYSKGRSRYINGQYGVCIDNGEVKDCFRYVIADEFDNQKQYPEDVQIFDIAEYVWAVFACKGALPDALQKVNKQIFTEWLPANPDYEIECGLNIEFYSDASQCSKGTSDENYYSEIWIPVKKK